MISASLCFLMSKLINEFELQFKAEYNRYEALEDF